MSNLLEPSLRSCFINDFTCEMSLKWLCIPSHRRTLPSFPCGGTLPYNPCGPGELDFAAL